MVVDLVAPCEIVVLFSPTDQAIALYQTWTGPVFIDTSVLFDGQHGRCVDAPGYECSTRPFICLQALANYLVTRRIVFIKPFIFDDLDGRY